MNRIEMFREALYAEKVAFDVELADDRTLTRDQRLARWELFLKRVQPVAKQLAVLEMQAERLRLGMALDRYAPAMMQ